MQVWLILGVILLLASYGYQRGRGGALASVSGDASKLHSLPSYHGAYLALWAAIPALIACVIWLSAEHQIIKMLVISGLSADSQALEPQRLALLMSDIRNLASGDIVRADPSPEVQAAAVRYAELAQVSLYAKLAAIAALSALCLFFAKKRIAEQFRARNRVERIVRYIMIAASVIAILTTIGLVLSLLFEAWRFFLRVPLHDFLFGTHWSPQTAIRADQVGASGSFGAIPIFAGTLLITLIAMAVSYTHLTLPTIYSV